MYWYGKLAFQEDDWQRYHWWERAGMKRLEVFLFQFPSDVARILPRLERSENGRLLHTVALLIRTHLHVATLTVFGRAVSEEELKKLQRVVQLHDALLQRARCATACMSIVARRCGLVKDVRVMIAKMAWKEPWHWAGEKRPTDASGAKCILQ
jgi:hypothetical protein